MLTGFCPLIARNKCVTKIDNPNVSIGDVLPTLSHVCVEKRGNYMIIFLLLQAVQLCFHPGVLVLEVLEQVVIDIWLNLSNHTVGLTFY